MTIGDQDVNGEGDPHLNLDSVLRGAVKSLDAQVLFDPAEEQFHLPALTIELGDGQGGQEKIVGEEYQLQILLGVEIVRCDAAERGNDARFTVRSADRLIAAYAGGAVDRARAAGG